MLFTIFCHTGADWIYGFLKRHDNLSVRTPEATSLSRSTSFNKQNVSTFFQNLSSVQDKFHFAACDIYNVDETALTTVHKPPKILTQKNLKQVGLQTSAERGTLVTLVGCINAEGRSIPPFLIFPRVHFKEFMLNGAPPGSAGTAHVSGWMNKEIFQLWLEHFVKSTRCSQGSPALLLMDNHISHLSISVINYAKENGLTLLTFPPHCSHKLQPLDRCVYGPLKKFYSDSCARWMTSHPGRTISIYEIGDCLGESYPRAFTPSNIMSGFRVAGIHPLTPDIFGDDEFMPSLVTDRPDPTIHHQLEDSPQASTSQHVTADASTSEVIATEKSITPQDVRPHGKALPRKNNCVRKKIKSLVLTNTPVKKRLEQEELDKSKKKPTKKRKIGLVPRVEDSSESDGDAEEQLAKRLVQEDSSGDEVDLVESDDACAENDQIKIGSYVLVQFVGKRQKCHYVGIVSETDSCDSIVSFFKTIKGVKMAFVKPQLEDVSEIDNNDVVMVLPPPNITGGTHRLAERLVFDIELSGYIF